MSGKNKKDGNLLSFFHKKSKKIDDIVGTDNSNVIPTKTHQKLLPISSASCERSFTAMRRIKTWTRATMELSRFTNISLLHIERDIIY